MIDKKEDHTAVLVVDVQDDFTQACQGSLAVDGTTRAALEKMAGAGVVLL